MATSGDGAHDEHALEPDERPMRPRLPSWSPDDQESRSAGHRAGPSMIVMDITIHGTFLPHDGTSISGLPVRL
jgi:hypothetical protein